MLAQIVSEYQSQDHSPPLLGTGLEGISRDPRWTRADPRRDTDRVSIHKSTHVQAC